ncbi:hypothetical protein [Micromonospora rubida]|uniref:hypothetical protein n=1 Tax=Micromonospora rubida TaxID=2697657 RepID=UPI0013789D47|nr:hypothetical protein [Micromonospora rubida]NBE84126.1 hypothetical protein [Micromonospora rubida]
MGVLYDYFRAADDEAVAALMAATNGGPLVGPAAPAEADVVEAKGVDPSVVLGQAVSLALDVPWAVDLVGDRLIWPDAAAAQAEHDGPWVVRLGDRVRDVLAAVAEDRLPALADRWSRIEELSWGEPAGMLPVLRLLVGLARRAQASGQHLYCWMSL